MATSEFLLLSFGENARVGGTVRVVAVASSEDAAKTELEGLDPSVLGHIALVEVKQHYERRPAVQSVPRDTPLFTSATAHE
jgi:hypothetical protein